MLCIWCFVDRASWHILTIRTNMMHYWLSIYFNDSPLYFDILLTVHLSIFISVINQLDVQNFCFTISLFHASTCFKHMCSKHVEAWNKLIVKQKFSASSWLITELNHLYMFQGRLLLIIMRYYPIYTAVGICHAFMLAGCLQDVVAS